MIKSWKVIVCLVKVQLKKFYSVVLSYCVFLVLLLAKPLTLFINRSVHTTLLKLLQSDCIRHYLSDGFPFYPKTIMQFFYVHETADSPYQCYLLITIVRIEPTILYTHALRFYLLENSFILDN